MHADEMPWRQTSEGVVLRVRLTPKASRDGVEGIEATSEGPAVKARVRAVPSDGEANSAVAKLVADWLDVPKSAVTLVSGGDPASSHWRYAASRRGSRAISP